VTSGVPHKRFVHTSLAAPAAMLVLLCSTSSVALGATESVVNCDEDSGALTSLRIPHSPLSVSRVDHATADSDPVELKSLESDIAEADNNVPLIYLTPRVADLLQNVFDSHESDKVLKNRGETPSSPLADSIDEQDSSNQLDEFKPNADVENEILPRYQQQMYRKDI